MKKQGFTILELLIATSVLTVGLIVVLSIFPVNRRYIAQSSATTQASFLAQEQIEYVRSLDYASLTTGTFEATHTLGSSSTDPLNQFSRQTTVSLIDGSYGSSASDVGLKKVVTTVTWTENNGARQYQLATFVHDQ
jgi:type IV pilus assembly protein PilV